MEWPIRQALERSGLLIIQSGVDAVGLRSPKPIAPMAAPTLAPRPVRPTPPRPVYRPGGIAPALARPRPVVITDAR